MFLSEFFSSKFFTMSIYPEHLNIFVKECRVRVRSVDRYLKSLLSSVVGKRGGQYLLKIVYILLYLPSKLLIENNEVDV